MSRLQNYTTAFAITLVIYLLTKLLFSIDLFDSIAAYVFILATLLFIFAREPKIKNPRQLENPQIHYYYKTQNNYYGYIMATGGALTAFLFYLASSRQDILLGPITLFFWATMILLSYTVGKYYDQNFIIDILYDFITRTSKVDSKEVEIRMLLRKLVSKEIENKTDAKTRVKESPVSKADKEIIIDKYFEDINEMEKVQISGEELDAFVEVQQNLIKPKKRK